MPQQGCSACDRKWIAVGDPLNVNVPLLKDEEMRGFRLTRQGLRVYHGRLDEGVDPRGRPYYWIAGMRPQVSPNAARISARWQKAVYRSHLFTWI